MEDFEIVQYLWRRDERAIKELQDKYGKYLYKIAYGILGNAEDSEECVNDAYIAAWGSIPPNKPENLKIYLVRIVKNNAFMVYRNEHAQKRGGGQQPLVLDELREVVSGEKTPEEHYLNELTKEDIQRFLDSLPEIDRNIFVRRYWLLESIESIATGYGVSNVYVRIKLHRTRNKMKKWLER